jgi:RNA polymerase sigma factor for flagellar operon FliA
MLNTSPPPPLTALPPSIPVAAPVVATAPRTAAERNRLIELGLPLVRRIAFRMARRLPSSVQVDDLISSGTEGLLRAVDAYDPARNDRFEPYAERRIRGSMLDELRAADVLTRHGRNRMAQVSRAVVKLEHELGRAPTEEEIAARLGVTLAEYQQLAMELSRAPAIGGLGDHDPDDVASAALDPAALFAEAELRMHLQKAVSELPERTLQVLSLYYQHECTQAEIGKILGVTESRVCQILGEAVVRLRGKLARAAVGPAYDEGP